MSKPTIRVKPYDYQPSRAEHHDRFKGPLLSALPVLSCGPSRL